MSEPVDPSASVEPLPDPATAPVAALVAAFAVLAERRGRAMDSDERAEGSRLSDQMVEFSMELELRGETAALLPLLEHVAPWVRLGAAQECLAVAPEKAGMVLAALSELDGVIEVYARLAQRLV